MLYKARFFLGYSNKIWAEGTMGKVHAPGGGGYWLRGRLVVLTSPAPPLPAHLASGHSLHSCGAACETGDVFLIKNSSRLGVSRAVNLL